MPHDFDRPAQAHSGAVQWRLFVRALADEVDSQATPGERDAMLRRIGRRMAGLTPLPAVEGLDTLEMEMNEALDGLGWGRVRLRLEAEARALTIRHCALPRVGSLGDPPGAWLASVLEGLYEGWLAQQPGSEASLVARLVGAAEGEGVVLRYGRAEPRVDNAATGQQIGPS